MAKVVQSIMNRGIGCGEKNVQDHTGCDQKHARLDKEQKLLR
jgi:hypothetical protein